MGYKQTLPPELVKNLNDPFWRLNNLYWVINEKSERVKFKMRYAQNKFYDEMWYWNEILKSRQHGFSTLIDIIGLDMCLFNDNIEAGIIAHTKEAVQKIFATKVKYPYDNLPKMIRDRIPLLKSNANELRFGNNSGIRVAMSMRSSTLRFLHVSERGKMCAKFPQKAIELLTGTLPALHEGSYFFDESTAEGGAGDFYDACIQSQADTASEKAGGLELNKMQSRFHFFAWHDDPKNTTEPAGITVSDELKRYFLELSEKRNVELTEGQKAWYALKRDGANGLGRLMKREHPSYPAEAFEQAVEGAVFAEELEQARSEGRVCFLPYQESVPVYTFWDLGIGHPTVVLFVQFIGAEVRIIDHHQKANRGITYHCKIVKDKPYVYEMHYLPHDAAKRNAVTAEPLFDTVEQLLGVGKVQQVDRCKAKGDSIEAARMIFPHVFFEAKKTTGLTKSLGFYRYEWDDDKKKYSDKPVDDWSADDSDAFQGLGMVWVEESIGGKRLGRTRSLIGNIDTGGQANRINSVLVGAGGGAYNNNVLRRGMR
jgi:hypothetical protein